MNTITVKIPEELDAALEKVSADRRVPKSAIVREALQKTLDAELKRPRVSAYSLMKKHLGIINSGLGDLSSNPAHMKDYGS